MLVDSHCHLDSSDFAAERGAVIARARSAGVETMLTICTRLDEFSEVLAIAEAEGGIWCSVGAHPH
jgi:TatD DNase family protein